MLFEAKINESFRALLALVLGLASGLPEGVLAGFARYVCLSRLGFWIKLSGRWRAGRGHSGAVAGIMGLFIVVIFVSYVIAPALVSFFAVATTSFSAGTAALWGVIGLFVVVAIILVIVGTTGML